MLASPCIARRGVGGGPKQSYARIGRCGCRSGEVSTPGGLTSLHAFLYSLKSGITDVDQALKRTMDIGDCHQRQ